MKEEGSGRRGASICTVLLAALSITVTVFCRPALSQIQTVQVTGGEIQGVVKNGVASFKGIPFAAPPIGGLRWKAPQPVKPWSGVRKADDFGPAPMQNRAASLIMGGWSRVSEDCLYLNVWTPATNADEKLPVMVWFYGGGFMIGMTSLPVYDGTKLAQKGVVLVSVAYRVGPFGFLAHPELSRESGKGSGNYGLQDQVAGLRWVRDNIARFGGDPSRVTIFGESAGGASVSLLTVVPSASGLFHRAIAESGSVMAPASLVPLSSREQAGQKFLTQLGATNLTSARALSAEEIQKAIKGISLGQFGPVPDGDFLPGQPYELFEASKFNDTPILIGSNSDEGAWFVELAFPGATPEGFEKKVRDFFGPAADDILQAYPHSTPAETHKSSKELLRDWAMGWPTCAWAKLQARKAHHPAYVYYFDHRNSTSPDGAIHGAEIAYVFRNLTAWIGAPLPPLPEDVALSELMSSCWVNFARTGDPNGPGLPAWLAFDEKEMKAMVFDNAPSARPLPNLEKLKVFDSYYALQGEHDKTGGDREK
jgi:para-nitrobenzyl esterase